VIFEGRQAWKAPLEDELWVRQSDLSPVRMISTTRIEDGEHTTLHRGTVDYRKSRFSALLPERFQYEKLIDGRMTVDNVATYSDFQMFSTTIDIEFEPTQ